jgi:hypothetical protein
LTEEEELDGFVSLSAELEEVRRVIEEFAEAIVWKIYDRGRSDS